VATFGQLFTNATTMRWMGTPVGGANQLAAGVAGIVFSAAIPIINTDQIAIEYAQVVKAAGSTTLRVQWATDQTISVDYPFIYEKSMTFAIAAGVATYTVGISEWSLTGVDATKILLPSVAHFCRIGIYASAVGATDDIRCSLTRLAGGNTQR